ncbi:MAG TPA: hypothetical protein VKV21_04905 [Solirubrobacteraceae bacterium]|nr:hypothetical protein [Solirubrobacteraceae bacterium]
MAALFHIEPKATDRTAGVLVRSRGGLAPTMGMGTIARQLGDANGENHALVARCAL